MSNLKRNFYEILNASSSNASIDELKSNYKQLILQCHPDKLQQQQKQQQLKAKTNNKFEINDDDPNNLEFVAITEAWNCLKDPVKRKQYDAELLVNKFHTHNNIYAHIKLSEMKKQPNTEDYYQDDEEEADQKKVDKEPNAKECEENESKYLYSFDCRCGGQYIVDESAEQFCRSGNNHHHTDTTAQIKSNDNNGVDDDDDADNTTQNNNKKNSPNNVKNENNGGGDGDGDAAAAGRKGIVQDNGDGDEEGGELIVECSECSLVIILNG